MKQKLFSASNDWTGLILRLTLGILLFPHGAQKMLGLFGGFGFSNTMAYFTGTAHLPWLIAFLVIIIEFFGSFSLLLGFAGRLWAGAVIVLMLGIIFSTHIDNGFFMNWMGNQKGEGYEYHLLVIGIALAIIAKGGGKYSLDGIISRTTSTQDE